MAVAKPAHQLKLAGHLQTRAAFEPSSFNAEKGTAELVFTTGARGLRQPWFGDDYFEELEVSESAVDLSRLNNGASLLAAHDGYSLSGVIGVVERAWIAGKEGRALVRFSDREDVKPIRIDVASGVLRHVSVGYTVQKYEKTEEEGNKIPILRATRWTPAEISLVPIAFDDAATVRNSAQPQPYEVEVVIPPQEQERNMADPTKQTSIPAAVSTPATAATPAVPVASSAAEPVDAARAAELAVKAERERVATIRSLVARQTLLPDADRATLADELIGKDTPVEQARAIILERLATESDKIRTDQHVGFEAGEDRKDKSERGIVTCLLERSNMLELVRSAAAKHPDDDRFKVGTTGAEFRGMRLADVARLCLEEAGVRTARMNPREIVGKAFTFRYAGTTDFPVLLESTYNKILLASYEMAAVDWRRFCGIGSVKDFRAQNWYRKGTFGTLDSLKENAEYKYKSIPDGEKASISASTKGNIIALTRQAIIDDDLGVFNGIASDFGESAQNSIEADAFSVVSQNVGMGPEMEDGHYLFDDSNHANVGDGNAIGISALDAEKTLMRKQMDKDGNRYLNLRPAILLLPLELEGTARLLNESTNDPDATINSGRKNIAYQMFRDIVASPWLSGTRRYLFADPARTPTIVVAFLDGIQAPYMESRQGWTVDGVEWKLRIDYGVGAVDWRTAVTDEGA